MVSRQLAASGGIWLSLGGTELLVDPGPGTLVQSVRRKLNAENLSAIILSHRHLDHSADTNVMVEAMTNGGFDKRGWVFAPADALGTEPVLFSYLKSALEGIKVLEAGGSYRIGNVTFTTPIRHDHQVETYGLLFHAGGHTFACIADSRYFEGLGRSYAAAELIIINTVLMEARSHVAHLAVADAGRLISEIRPKAAILNHYGMGVWQAEPEKIAKELTQKTGVRVIAARDGMVFDLDGLEAGTPQGE
jgi:ribonuclease BN (tRNA processing enzyme)